MKPERRITVADDVDEVLHREPMLRYDPDACAEQVRKHRAARGETEPAKIGTVLREFYRKRKKR